MNMIPPIPAVPPPGAGAQDLSNAAGVLSGSAFRPASEGKADAGAGVFNELFAQFLGDVNELQLQAEQAGEDFVLGRSRDVAALVLATQKASMALDLTIQIRNKLVEAYQEVMRMQV